MDMRGRQGNTAICAATFLALPFNLRMARVAIGSILLTVPKGERTRGGA